MRLDFIPKIIVFSLCQLEVILFYFLFYVVRQNVCMVVLGSYVYIKLKQSLKAFSKFYICFFFYPLNTMEVKGYQLEVEHF